ncbi:hypothetical protein SKAU_G00103830 [Synaphobranchus kaupii]|uniref:Uncharacterized protein n=1 Tax=Synaphobranchus kaupii TaxID=118154 RepID=A0A9Q1FZ39_SYNKA|nr:hypothetical protein SKAU_G00103830 [Synaphobranchus kaupii]
MYLHHGKECGTALKAGLIRAEISTVWKFPLTPFKRIQEGIFRLSVFRELYFVTLRTPPLYRPNQLLRAVTRP